MCGPQKRASLVGIDPRAEPTGAIRTAAAPKPLVRAPVPNKESERNVARPLLWVYRDRSLSRPGSLLSAAAPPDRLEVVA